MSLRSAIFSTTSLVFLATSASADVSAKDIWTDWQNYMAGFGYSVDGTETMFGNTLKVSDLKMSIPIPEAGGNFELNLENVDFVENGDGTVNLVFPETMPMTFVALGPEGEAVSGALNYTMNNMDMRASGDLSKIQYDYSADQIGIVLTELVVDGDTLASDALEVKFSSNGLSGQTIMEPGALRKIVQTMALGATEYTLKFTDIESDAIVNFAGSMAALNMQGDSVVPISFDPENVNAALESGFAVDGNISYTGSNTAFSIIGGGDEIKGSSSAETASIGVTMNKDALGYSGSSTGVNFNMNGNQVPLPIVAGLGELAFNILIPVAKSEAPSDFALGVTLGDFVTSDQLWSMFDPGNILPRDPATVSFDLTGKAKLLFDFFDPTQLAAVENGEAMPAELNAITLRNLRVAAAGAELTGTGDFTFDNNDLESFGGFPKPTGGIDVGLVGGNGLMDKLVQMGLLPQEQAMGARMMMGLFTRPAEGPDSLTTKVEINEQGHVLANGQRIQ